MGNNGNDPSVVMFGLPRPPHHSYSVGLNGTSLVMITMIVMFILTLLALRQNRTRLDNEFMDKPNRPHDNSRRDNGGGMR